MQSARHHALALALLGVEAAGSMNTRSRSRRRPLADDADKSFNAEKTGQEQAAELAELLEKFTRPDPAPAAGKQTES